MLLYEHYGGKTPFQIKYSVNQSRITKTIFLFNFFFFFFGWLYFERTEIHITRALFTPVKYFSEGRYNDWKKRSLRIS